MVRKEERGDKSKEGRGGTIQTEKVKERTGSKVRKGNGGRRKEQAARS